MRRLFILLSLFLCCSLSAAPAYKHILLRDFRNVSDGKCYNFNIGTTAHGPGTLSVLQKYLPGDVEITVWASCPLTPSLQKMMERRFPDVNIVWGAYSNPDKAPAALREAVDRSDLFLVSSGSGISPNIRASLRDFINNTGKPVAAYAIGFNPDQEEFLRRMDFAWFRDEISAREAREQEYTPDMNGWAPDAVFYFDCVDPVATEKFLKDKKLESGKFICCIPGFRFTPSGNLDEKKREKNEKYLDRDNAILRQTIIDAVRKFGVKVLICPEQIPEVEICKSVIYDKLPPDVQANCEYVTELWAPDLALGVYRQSLCVYGIEMHSQVMALGNGVPACIFRHSGFRNKSDMWNSFGVGDWLLDIDDEDATAKACSIVNSILSDPQMAARKVARAKEIADSASRAAVNLAFFKQAEPRFSRDEIMAHWSNLCGNGSPYPDSLIVGTKAPKGYKPFYITHFGRHGSRYLNHADQYEGLYDILRQADSMGLLTDTGKEVFFKTGKVAQEARGKYGRLLPRGEREHAGIMERMVRSYPEVFHRGAKIDILSTDVSRVKVSMNSAVARLKELVPGVQVTTASDDFGDNLFKPAVGNKLGKYKKYKTEFGDVSDSERIEAMLFRDSSFLSKKQRDNLVYWFWTASIGALLNDDLGIDLFQYLEKEEIYPLWKKRGMFFYNAFGPGENPEVLDSLPLLRRMIGLVDAAVAGNGNDADLHYGHDTQVVPFERLVGIEDCCTPVPEGLDPARNIDRYYWDFAACPMGGNVQFVFYRKKHKGEILMKCLMNEHEMHFSGLEPYNWPYYRWSDVREYWLSRLEKCKRPASDAVASYTLKDGTEGTLAVYRCSEVDGAVRYYVPAESIPDGVSTLSIQLDQAKARKGDEGFWILERGCLGHFNKDHGSFGTTRNWLNLPYFGMKTPKRTFLAVMEGMRFEFKILGQIKNGRYSIAPVWQIGESGFGAYETPSILVYELPMEADYNEMAKVYRRYKESRDPEIRPIKERMKERPQLEKLANSIALRQKGAEKPFDKAVDAIDFTAETEHQPYCVESFEKMLELLRRMKNELGMDDVAVCVAGWQTGGYDGRGPKMFPVCEEAGGEQKLRELIKGGQELGYIVDAHTNFTDCFTVSPMWDGGNVACMNPEGGFDTNGAWHAGKAYNLCLKYAWDNYMQEDLRKVRDLGFYGCHYIDVFTAAFPYRCCNPAHSANRTEVAQIQRQAALLCRELFGGFASECCMDHLLGCVDYINYAQRKERDRRTALEKGNKLPTGADWDELVPFFELAFHDVVLSNPDKVTQEIPRGDDYLFLVEFGGRPIIYSFTEDNIDEIKEAYDRFQPLKHLMVEEMVSHKRLADGVACVTYGNGEKVIVNRSGSDFLYEDSTIPAGDYILKR